MIHILVIQKDKETKGSLYNVLKSLDNIKLSIVVEISEAIDLLKKNYFELVFLDASEELLDSATTIKKHNSETMIVSFNSEYDERLKERMFAIGIKDCIRKNTSEDVISLRIHNYLEIVALKKQRLYNTQAVNLFDKNIFQHFVVFKLNTPSGRVEFWDYFKNEHFKMYEFIEESIGVLYAFSSWIYENNRECEIIKETGDNALYLTLQPVDFISDEVVQDIIAKHDKGVQYLKKENKLSLKLSTIDSKVKPLVKSKIDSETKKILGKTHFDKITAVEFVESTAISYMNKIEALSQIEEDIDLALLDFEKAPDESGIQKVANYFLEYIEVLKLLVEFDHIVFAISKLINAMNSVTKKQLGTKEVKKFTTLTLHLVNDISRWRENIFVKQEANDIHYLDSSLLSSCLQIESIFDNKIEEEEEENFELF